MNLSHLYYFRELARIQHYTKAAHNLYISQSTLSHSITTLEEELDCKLFQKEGRNVTLTDDGILFAKYVEKSLETLDNGIGELKKRHGRLSGLVRFGSIQSVRAAFLPEAVLAYRRTRGTLIEFRIDQGSTNELLYNLKTGTSDFAITSEFKGDGFEFTSLFKHRLVAIVHKGHPLAQRKSLSLKELAALPLYTYREGIIVGTEINALFAQYGINLEEVNINRDSDDEMILGGIVSRTPVVGLSLDTPGLSPYKDLVKIPLKEKEASTIHPIGILKIAGKHLSPAAKDFMDFLIDFAHNYYREKDETNSPA